MTPGELFLIGLSFFTSLLTAVLGIGGGLLLVAVMPGFLPATAVIPVHGVVQLASNASRVAFGFRDLELRLVVPFLFGSVAAAAVGARWAFSVPSQLLPVLLGIFVLIVTWTPRRLFPTRLPGGFATLGAVQTFLSLFVGATGPLSSAFLSREGLSRDRTVVTHAGLMTVLHFAKLLAFVAAGFVFRPYAILLCCMVVSVSLGSYAGTQLRTRVSEDTFRVLFKVLLTLLSLRLTLGVAV